MCLFVLCFVYQGNKQKCTHLMCSRWECHQVLTITDPLWQAVISQTIAIFPCQPHNSSNKIGMVGYEEGEFHRNWKNLWTGYGENAKFILYGKHLPAVPELAFISYCSQKIRHNYLKQYECVSVVTATTFSGIAAMMPPPGFIHLLQS